jgi:hypothetical protein
MKGDEFMLKSYFYRMLEDYQKINTDEDGISFAKEGFNQLYKEGVAGLQWEFVRGTVVGGVTVGVISLGVVGYKKLKHKEEKRLSKEELKHMGFKPFEYDSFECNEFH